MLFKHTLRVGTPGVCTILLSPVPLTSVPSCLDRWKSLCLVILPFPERKALHKELDSVNQLDAIRPYQIVACRDRPAFSVGLQKAGERGLSIAPTGSDSAARARDQVSQRQLRGGKSTGLAVRKSSAKNPCCVLR